MLYLECLLNDASKFLSTIKRESEMILSPIKPTLNLARANAC